MKTIFMLLPLCLSTALFAQADLDGLPQHCFAKGYTFDADKLKLNVSSYRKLDQNLYLIKNTTASNIWLNHQAESGSANAGWATEIGPDKWMAIVLEGQTFDIECVELKPGAEQYIPCQTMLKVCQMQDVKFPAASQGNYWAAENLNLAQLLDELARRGISLSTK